MNQTTSEPVEIRIEGLTKAFDGHQVLRGVDLDIHAGAFIAVVGGSGCGKSVLLNHVLGLMQPDGGRVLVADPERTDGTLLDLAALDADRMADIHVHWGVVFQRNALFSGTVLDNIGLWLEEVGHMGQGDIERVAQRVLAAVGLPGSPEFLEGRVESLSGGMAKRIAIARALAMKPRCMFFDEPTTGLDPVTASQIQDLLLSTHVDESDGRALTTIVVTHDKDLLYRLRPRVVMLHEGRVSFDGPFEEFEASDSPIIRPYFELMPVLHQGEHG
ncbi:ABC-type transport system [Magnetospirillum sp. XM-1]|uniref:ABC transporter ATP-binding protein n=1 Tax=Magnetospirillum sp. XM-1 TaxID=1663591 RepID=UPI00073DBA22|nr:ATP-binding cassette domain-containing protein [Magnetospirillum sp. XM-1]CUW37301.1 ABC-type transport system [Magnetospirillum sp. XM-1]